MYALVWTPNFCGVEKKLETFDDHDSMASRLREIHDAKYEDVNWAVYLSMKDDDGFYEGDLEKIISYHTEVSAMELYVDPKWYGGRDYHDENIKEARLGIILMKYIDRLCDPVETPDMNGYTDKLEDIVEELRTDVDKEIEVQRSER